MSALCAPTAYLARRVQHCPTCGRGRRFVVALYGWYPPIATCCACGDSWSEDGRMRRPFARDWRADAIRRARADWDRAGTWADAARDSLRSAIGPWRLQRSRAKGARLPAGTVCVTRPGRWGNPFVPVRRAPDRWDVEFRLAAGQERGETYRSDFPTRADALRVAVDLYALHVGPFGSIETDPAEIRAALGGHHLGCWCREGDPCHGDVLLAIANGWPLPDYLDAA